MSENEKQSEWCKSISSFLLKHSGAEAVTLDTGTDRVSVATIGLANEEELRKALQETIRSIKSAEIRIEEKNCDCDSGSPLVDCRQENGKIILKKKTCPTAPHFWKWRDYPVDASKVEIQHGNIHEESKDLETDWKLLAKLAIGCAVGVFLGFLLPHLGLPKWCSVAAFIVAMCCGGFEAAIDVKEKLRKGELDINFLMLAVAVGASSIGHWSEGALLLLLFSISGTLEHYAMARTQRAISSLFKEAPKTANVINEQGVEQAVPVEQVEVGSVIFVRPGDVFPLDGEVIEGESSADESQLTGEAVPVDKRIGSKVFSGTQNLLGAVKCKVLKSVNESSLQKIITLIQDAQQQKAPTQRFTDKFGTKYTIGILLVTLVMFFVWWLALGLSPFVSTSLEKSAFYRAMTLLVVASPCALVISIPSAILAAIAFGARRGVLFRGGAAVERLCEVNLVALDKTGTLTTGELSVEQFDVFPEEKRSLLIEATVALEQNANHPLARAIVQYGKENGISAEDSESFQSIVGKGLRGRYKGTDWVIGRRELVNAGPLAAFAKQFPLPASDFSEIWVIGDEAIGRILLKDKIRKESTVALKAMREDGLKTVMLTGDRREAGERIGLELGVDEVCAGLSPEEKVKAIHDFEEKGYIVAMVGDGVNDAPAFAAAHVSVGMGVRGSDAALEQSDVVLTDDRIDKFLTAFRLSKRANRIIKQNLVISLGTILVMVVSSLLAGIPLTFGVFMHEGSTVIVCLNSLRLLFGSKS